jgi:hypothetical protein
MATVSEENPEEKAAEETSEAAPEKTGDALFDALWARVMEAWDDDKPHAAILDLALKNQMLPDLAGRYRKIKETDEAKAARAQKKIDGIVVAATQMLMSMKTPARTKTPMSWTLSVGAVCLIVILWLAWKLYGGR